MHDAIKCAIACLAIVAGCGGIVDEPIGSVSHPAGVIWAERPLLRGVTLAADATRSEVDDLIDAGVTAVRISFDIAVWNELDSLVRYASSRGVSVILEPSSEESWGRLARAYRDDGRIIFGLKHAAHAIAAIRAEGAGNLILVRGPKPGVVDPNDNYAFELETPSCESVALEIDWLRMNGRRGFLGRTCSARTLRLIEQNTDVMLGWTVTAGGRAGMQAIMPFLRPLQYRAVILSGAEYGPLPGRSGIDYVYPTTSELDHFLGHGMTTILLPLRWERLQPIACEPLAEAELARLDGVISAISARGGTALLRLDGPAAAYGGVIGADLSDAVFADLWSRLAARYRTDARVAFGLAAYTHDVPTERWASAAQAAITAVRAAGGHNLVVVSGNGWSDASQWSENWYGTSNAIGMKSVIDPENNVAFDVRLFLDVAGNGSGVSCASSTSVVERLRPFVDWLRSEDRRGFIGAIGGPSGCLPALASAANAIEGARDVVVGYAYSQAGAWSTNHPFSIEPIAGRERPQWTSLAPVLRVLRAEAGVTTASRDRYCAEVMLRNEGAPPAIWRAVRIRIDGARVTTTWNGAFKAGDGELRIVPGGMASIASNGFVRFGFCATDARERPIEILSVE